MVVTNQEFAMTCGEHLDRFFGVCPDAAMQKRAVKALRFLAAAEKPLLGEPAGWAAGIVYELATRGRRACGVPGILNSDFEELFGVSMGTIRRRAAQVGELLAL